MIIDHIGIVVRSIEDGISHWEKVFGYKQHTKVVINKKQKVKIVFLEKKDSETIKLIEPLNEESPVYKAAMRGGGLHHLCFRCNNMQKEIDRLENMGLRVLTKPEPGEAFENHNIAFIYAKYGLNIELIDTKIKANRLYK